MRGGELREAMWRKATMGKLYFLNEPTDRKSHHQPSYPCRVSGTNSTNRLLELVNIATPDSLVPSALFLADEVKCGKSLIKIGWIPITTAPATDKYRRRRVQSK